MRKIKFSDILAEILLSYKNVISVILDFYLGDDIFQGKTPKEIAEKYLINEDDPNSPRVTVYEFCDSELDFLELRYGILFKIKTPSDEIYNICISCEDYSKTKNLRTRFQRLKQDLELVSFFSPHLENELSKFKSIWIILDTANICKDSTIFNSFSLNTENKFKMISDSKETNILNSSSYEFFATFLGNSGESSIKFYNFLYNYLKGDMSTASEILESFNTLPISQEQFNIMLLYENARIQEMGI